MAKPLLIAYSYQDSNPTSAPEELRALIEICKAKMPPLQLPGAFDDAILKYFESEYGSEIQVFHFAGHAVDKHLVVSGEYISETECFLDMRYFSKLIGIYGKGLKLVFLNACETDEQAKYLLDAGIPAVIATTIPVKDTYAFLFAKEFYSVFLKGDKSLQEALDEAHARLNDISTFQLIDPDSSKIKENWLDEKHRGNFKIDNNRHNPDTIYQLFGTDAVKAQRFVDWQIEKTVQPQPIRDLDRTKPVHLGISVDSYLLCDRKPQVNTFQTIIKNKVKGDLPEPNFIFISCHNSDCLRELLQRFTKFILPQYCPEGFLLESLEFPEAEFFDIPGDPKKPLTFLDEICKDLKGKKSEQKFDNDTLLVLCHKIYSPFWKDGLIPLFEYYLSNCSKIMQQELSERLVILFVIIHTDQPEEKLTLTKYAELYDQLKQKYPTKVEFFSSLPLIRKGDLLQWYDEVYESTLNTDKLPIKQEGIYYLEAIDLMKEIIAIRNSNA